MANYTSMRCRRPGGYSCPADDGIPRHVEFIDKVVDPVWHHNVPHLSQRAGPDIRIAVVFDMFWIPGIGIDGLRLSSYH